MKKLLGIAALCLAFTPFAHAQDRDMRPEGHPDARNDRTMESTDRRDNARRSSHAVKQMHHPKHRDMKRDRHDDQKR
jgi:hypothetical protein